MPYFKAILFLTVILFCGCDALLKDFSQQENTSEKKGKANGIVKSYRKDKTLLSEITFKDGIRNGVAKDYYKNGKVHYELYYQNGLREGEAKWYYESGNIYQVLHYRNDKKDGIEKKFHENGQLMAEIFWKNGMIGKGTKEYTEFGKLITGYPEIVIKPVNTMAFDNKYLLKIYLDKKMKKVEYYMGNLSGEIFVEEGNLRYLFTSNDTAIYSYFMPPGSFYMEKVSIIARFKTRMGNPYVLQKIFNVAIENK